MSVHADNQGGTSQIEWLRQLKFPQSSQEIPLLVSLGAAILKNEYLFQVKRFDDQEVAIIQIAHPSHDFLKMVGVPFNRSSSKAGCILFQVMTILFLLLHCLRQASYYAAGSGC